MFNYITSVVDMYNRLVEKRFNLLTNTFVVIG